ncbi:MAG: FprA family A-type flavoprotein [Clostridia bacterium]|nr:FprA family A-type flavoprotein [Clostridia bacterium]
MKKITEDILYVGVDDKQIDLFEGLFPVPSGIAYNSYIILDDKIAVMDAVEAKFVDQWLASLDETLDGKSPDYLVVHHMEPDHSAGIAKFLKKYPEAKVVSTAKTFAMMQNFFGAGCGEGGITVGEGQTLSLGSRELKFFMAPMVHWPEVMMTYDSKTKTLFSADAFGRFGALDTDEPWEEQAGRYYFSIVGKYGMQVQAVLRKLAAVEVKRICALHGPVLEGEDLKSALKYYDTWSRYQADTDGVLIAYGSVYGNTEKAAKMLAGFLRDRGIKHIEVFDLARCDESEAVEEAFRYSTLVLASVTYNGEIFPPVREYIDCLVERNYQNRRVGIIENGSWAPVAGRAMIAKFEKSKNITILENKVKITSALNLDSIAQLSALADEIAGK